MEANAQPSCIAPVHELLGHTLTYIVAATGAVMTALVPLAALLPELGGLPFNGAGPFWPRAVFLRTVNVGRSAGRRSSHTQKKWPAGQRPPCRFPNSSGNGHRAGKVLDNAQF